MTSKKNLVFWLFLLFTGINAIAFIHAYNFTHFTTEPVERTKDPKELSLMDKANIVLTGIDNPKPSHKALPEFNYTTHIIKSDVLLESWFTKVGDSRGTVILFHGYAGEKSLLISRAEAFQQLGYNTLLVDFRGSGGSEGNATTIGFSESVEVIDCYHYVRSLGEDNIHLFGTSMGSVAIMKALKDYPITPTSIVLECPFGSLHKTVSARFKLMGLPAFPMAGLLSFWGGAQHGYWAFSHNPQEYAAYIKTPVLLLFGMQDDRVSMEETTALFNNFKGKKVLVTYADQGHDIFTEANQPKWISDVASFMHKFD